MKIVEGHIEMLRMYRDLSGASRSDVSELFRDYINSLDRALATGFGDIVPRIAEVHPSVDENGEMSNRWIQPDRESGRIVSRKS